MTAVTVSNINATTAERDSDVRRGKRLQPRAWASGRTKLIWSLGSAQTFDDACSRAWRRESR